MLLYEIIIAENGIFMWIAQIDFVFCFDIKTVVTIRSDTVGFSSISSFFSLFPICSLLLYGLKLANSNAYSPEIGSWLSTLDAIGSA